MKTKLFKFQNRIKLWKVIALMLVITQSTIAAPFVTQDSGTTVLDEKTGLIWQRCSRGQTVDFTCSGTATTDTWANALTYCNTLTLAGRTWRLPNINELKSIVDRSKASGATIDLTVFPATAVAFNYWSSSTYVPVTAGTWSVNFSNGYVRCVSTL